MKDLTTISSDLFNKIRSRFTDIKIGDEKGAITTDPTNARFFDVNYTVDGQDLGRVNLKIDDESLTVIYNNSMLDGQVESVKTRWYNFLKELRQFARKSLLTFDTRDITKSNLEKRDYEYLAQGTGDTSMSESKLFGTSKTSYQDMGEAKIIVKHSQPVNYNLPAGRTQRIESIYIENASGERFKYPSRHLNGARAMAVHVANGGAPYDAIGGYISGLSEELSKLRQFKQYTQRSGVMAEAMGDLTERVAERIDAIKHEIASLQRQSNYAAFKESFQVSETQEVPEETANSWIDALTIKTFNEELKSVFPYIYKLVSEKKTDEVRYEDIVGEEVEEEVTESEVNHLADFEQHLDAISTLEHEVVESDEDEEVEETQQVAPTSQEVVEFITSMYDPEAKTFPRGEEGVKIAVEKKFGEGAGRFAHYVVEKLSAKPFDPEQFGSDGAGAGAGDISKDDDTEMDEGYKKFGATYAEKLALQVFQANPNLTAKGRAEEVVDAGWPLAVKELGRKRAEYEFSYDEDFTSDFVSAYHWLQLGGNPETGEDGEEYTKKYGHLFKGQDESAQVASPELEAIRQLAGL